MIDNDGPVWAVCRPDRSHRIRFPGREDAQRWMANHSERVWQIVPTGHDEHGQEREPRE